MEGGNGKRPFSRFSEPLIGRVFDVWPSVQKKLETK